MFFPGGFGVFALCGAMIGVVLAFDIVRFVRARLADDAGLILEVADSGMGIAPDVQRKILATFYTSKGLRGTGLGLLLTKRTVEEHGGRIGFTSTPGQGTVFRIELPAETASPAWTDAERHTREHT